MWTNDIVDAEMDEKHYAYLPSVIMHEFEHVLGVPDASDLPNPEQYEGNLMHWSKDDWGDENEDLWPDRLMNASTEQLEAPILTVEDIEVGTTQDYYDDLESQGKLLE